MTSATWRGVAMRWPEDCAEVAGPRLIQPVSVIGGCTTLAVTPNRANSVAALSVKLTCAALAAP